MNKIEDEDIDLFFENEDNISVCQLCSRKISKTKKKLKNHIKSRHPKEFQDILAKKNDVNLETLDDLQTEISNETLSSLRLRILGKHGIYFCIFVILKNFILLTI